VPGASFCRACGTRRERQTCANCDAPLLPGAVFCRGCGTRLADPGAEPEPGREVVTAVRPPSPPAPSEPPPSAPAPKERREGSWRTPVLIALAILLLGVGVAAAIVITGGGGSGGTTTVAENAAAGSGEEAEGEEGVAEAGETDSNGLPRIGEGEMRQEVESLLVAYHEDVVAGDFRSAWGLLSARKRQQDLAEYGYRKWKQAQASLSGYLAPAGLQASIDGFEGEGVVRVDVTGMGWSDPDASCSEWSGLTWVRYEGGAWTYDPGYSTTAARRRTWQPRTAELLGAGC
jgi:hypothetical protein